MNIVEIPASNLDDVWGLVKKDIAQALAEHGIDMASERNAIAMFETLRAEYIGGLAIRNSLR